MFSPASKVCFTLAGGSLAAAVAYAVGIGDRDGLTLLVTAAGAALALGLVFVALVGPDLAEVSDEDDAETDDEEAEDADVVAVPLDVSRPSPWPAAAAATLALLVAAPAVGAPFVLGAVVLGLITAFGWLAQAWQEHPSWNEAMTERLNQRFVVPLGLPVVVVALVAVAVISFSRILLAVSKEAAAVLAIVAALAILGAFSALAAARNVGRSAMTGLAVLAALLVLASGVVGAAMGEREFHVVGHEEHALEVTAEDIAFDVAELDVPQLTEVELLFHNRDEGVSHNFSIYTEEGGEPVFEGEIIVGEDEIAYHLPPLEVRQYWFQCDVHPDQMNGVVLVSEEASAEGKPGQPPNASTTSTTHP